jgi:DICT domain-containing protein
MAGSRVAKAQRSKTDGRRASAARIPCSVFNRWSVQFSPGANKAGTWHLAPRRDAAATIRLTREERERLQRAADDTGVSFSEYLRVAGLAFARRQLQDGSTQVRDA